MLVPMTRIELIGPKSRFSNVVALLHEQGSVQLQDLSKVISQGEMPVDQMSITSPVQVERERLEDMLIRVRAIVRSLHAPGTRIAEDKRVAEYTRMARLSDDELSAEISRVIDEVEDRTADLAQSQIEMQNELTLLARYEPLLHKIQPLAEQIVTTGAFESVALLVERRYKGALEQLKEELDTLTHCQCEIISIDVDEDTTAAIVVFNKTYSEPVHKLLAVENINQIRLPSDLEGMPFDAAYTTIIERRASLPKELEAVRRELDTLSSKWLLRLSTIRDVLADKVDEIIAIPKFGETGYAFVITGWMPLDDLPRMRDALQRSFGDDVILTNHEIDQKDFTDTPVAFKNPKFMQPFESLLSVYGLPRYGTLDSTWMLFVFYPLFFGMIVGDIGYGLIMVGIVMYLRYSRRDSAGMQLATSVLGPAAIMVVVFGLLYGEFFGNLLGPEYLNVIRPITMGPVTLPWNRVEAVMAFMYIAIGIGVVHVMLGLVFGIVNALRTKNKHHLYERGGILTFLVALGIAIVISVETRFFGQFALFGQIAFTVIALVGVWFAIRGGGVMGAVETMESVTGIASYIRIMAVGLAGAIFADSVNEIVSKSGNVVLGILIAIVLHGMNFVIAAFSPTIHALRLNFLEFFRGFYETGSKAYSPFHKTGGEKSA